MKNCKWLFLCAALTLGADEVKAPVTGAMIFKNGVAAVRRKVEPGKLLVFDLACDIQPLLGGLWFSGPVVSVVRQETKKPVAGTYPIADITKTFAGKNVTLLVNSADKAVREISGTVWDPDPKPEKGNVRPVYGCQPAVWIKRADGTFEMVQRHLILGIRCPEQPKAVPLPEKHDRRPVWHFTLSRPAEKAVFVDFLTGGLQWQSAYRIELGKNKKMIVSQDVEIVNNLADLEGVSLFLASGFANFMNRGNISPMSMVQPVSGSEHVVNRQFAAGMLNQQAADYDGVSYAAPMKRKAQRFGSAATGEIEDISLLSIPGFSLKKGEVCHRVIGSAETAYEHLVHWTIRPMREAVYGRNTGGEPGIPMDALRFINPFSVPITASPVEIIDGGMVLAQVKIPWVNPKQRATLDITRALSVTGKVLEYEVSPESTARAEQVFTVLNRSSRGNVISGSIAGTRYRITDVIGEIRIRNYRKLPARMVIDLEYSGAFVSADENPVKEQQNRGMSINPNSRMSWDLTLPAGAEKVLKYRYNVFVNH